MKQRHVFPPGAENGRELTPAARNLLDQYVETYRRRIIAHAIRVTSDEESLETHDIEIAGRIPYFGLLRHRTYSSFFQILLAVVLAGMALAVLALADARDTGVAYPYLLISAVLVIAAVGVTFFAAYSRIESRSRAYSGDLLRAVRDLEFTIRSIVREHDRPNRKSISNVLNELVELKLFNADDVREFRHVVELRNVLLYEHTKSIRTTELRQAVHTVRRLRGRLRSEDSILTFEGSHRHLITDPLQETKDYRYDESLLTRTRVDASQGWGDNARFRRIARLFGIISGVPGVVFVLAIPSWIEQDRVVYFVLVAIGVPLLLVPALWAVEAIISFALVLGGFFSRVPYDRTAATIEVIGSLMPIGGRLNYESDMTAYARRLGESRPRHRAFRKYLRGDAVQAIAVEWRQLPAVLRFAKLSRWLTVGGPTLVVTLVIATILTLNLNIGPSPSSILALELSVVSAIISIVAFVRSKR